VEVGVRVDDLHGGMLSIPVPTGAGAGGHGGAAAGVLASFCAAAVLVAVAGVFFFVRAVEDGRFAEDPELPGAPLPPPEPARTATSAGRDSRGPRRDAKPVADETPLRAEIARLEAALATRPALRHAEPVVRDDALERALRAEIDRALDALARDPQTAPAHARDAAAIGPLLLPLLLPSFPDPVRGPAAIRLAGSLPGAKARDLVLAASAAGVRELAHCAALTEALADAARRGDADGLLAAASRTDLAPAIGLAAMEAVAAIEHEGAAAAIAAGLARSVEEHHRAVALLVERGPPGRTALMDALDDASLPGAARRLALRALLPDARAGEARRLGRAILGTDGGLAEAAITPVAGEAVGGILAEALAAMPSSDAEDLLGHVLALESDAGAAARDAAAFSAPGVVDHLRAIARERGVPLVRTGEDLVARAKTATAVDVPDLLDGLDLAAPPKRAQVAAGIARAGHPEGIAVLGRLASRLDPEARRAVALAIAEERLAGAGDLLALLVSDEDASVASASAEAIHALDFEIEPSRGIAALAVLRSPSSQWVLDAMARRAPARQALTTLLVDALERGAVADVHAAAGVLLALNAEAGPEFAAGLLGHREPAVRAAALRGVGRSMATDRARWLSVIERVSADDDALVRVAAAWALGCLKDALARARLVALARDPSWLVREAAVLGLAAQESRNLVPVLRRALDDPAPLVANAAKVALARHGAADVGPALLADLGDPAVATRTLEALVTLVGKRDLARDALAAEVERLAGADSRPR
jgi:hypothetical protein